MGYQSRIQAALASRPEEKLFGHQVATLAGITSRAFQRDAGEMVMAGLISREKPGMKGRSAPSTMYRYFMTGEQRAAFRQKAVAVGRRYGSLHEPNEMSLVTDTHELPGRLSFLRMLKEKTVFGDHATLALIIKDYERTLKMRMACELRAEEEDKRGGGPPRQAMEMRA